VKPAVLRCSTGSAVMPTARRAAGRMAVSCMVEEIIRRSD
jgi:hypothetical protein